MVGMYVLGAWNMNNNKSLLIQEEHYFGQHWFRTNNVLSMNKGREMSYYVGVTNCWAQVNQCGTDWSKERTFHLNYETTVLFVSVEILL